MMKVKGTRKQTSFYLRNGFAPMFFWGKKNEKKEV
jgi:hypothetical protein